MAIITAISVLTMIDLIIYLCTPFETRQRWPWWKYLPGGAIIARLLLTTR